MIEQDIRWKQRFENLDKALSRLLETQEAYSKTENSALLRIALIGAFMFTFLASYLPAFQKLHQLLSARAEK